MNRRIFLFSALALSGCATSPPRVRTAASGLAELEPLYRAEAGREAITVSVASNGCTTKADFAFHVEQVGPTTTLAFGRRRIDTCKSFAMGRVDLSFTWAELGVARGTPVVLLNPVSAWLGPGA